ncbi:MAG: oligosaccharide flippase family protein [Clostridia bacterium]|nr:oligosaccharide flippase family protein [Clostridia bacterium]
MRSRRWQIFWRNALLTSAVSLILRSVAVSFNVYLTEKLGADGIGLYTLVMSVYGFGVTVATSGIHLAATRLVAEANGADAVRRAMRACLRYSLLFGTLASVLLMLLAPVISEVWLEDPRTLPALRLLGVSMLPIALSSAMGGYFAGVRRVYKSAAVQLTEQGVRVVLVICALQVFLPRGLEYACIGVVLGGVIAEYISFCILLISYLWDRRRAFGASGPIAGSRGVGKKLCGIALPVAFSAYARSFLVTVEHLLIPICLRKNGASRDASLAAYGTLHSMALPVLLFPSALLGSASGLLIPEMAEYRAAGQTERIRSLAERVLDLALIFSIGTAGVMSCHAYAMGHIIYGSAEAADFIRRLAPLVPLMYLDNTVDAMLKGLGEQVYSMNVNILDAMLSVVLVLVLLPRWGTDGYIVVLFVCEGFNAVCSLYRLLSIAVPAVRPVALIGQPLAAVIGATIAARLFGMRYPITDGLTLALHLAMTIGCYLSLLGVMRWCSACVRGRRRLIRVLK